MKKTINVFMIALALFFVGKVRGQNDEGKITVEITKEIDGEKKTFKGEYNSREEMYADPNYQEFSGDHNQFHFWSDDGTDAFFDMDQLGDMQKDLFEFFDDEGGSSAFFFHDFDDEASSNLKFHFDSFDSEELSDELREKNRRDRVCRSGLAHR